jgi:GNAT superfamily N-acetyltransferase
MYIQREVEKMEFREANAEDFEACLPLLQQLWPTLKITGIDIEIQIVEEIKEIFYRLLKNPDTKVILAENDGHIIALIDLTFRETLFYRGWAMIIEDLIVDENYRRRGIGSKLVRLAEEIAQQRDCHNIELNSDLYRKETHYFWEEIGYERKAYQFRKVITQSEKENY